MVDEATLKFIDISIHSLRMEGDICNIIYNNNVILFQSTPSAWRETEIVDTLNIRGFHFNPLPPHGGRRVLTQWQKHRVLFQSTPSAWRETTQQQQNYVFANISIHSLRMEGDVQITINFQFLNISIHSLRMEGDIGIPTP